MIIWSYHKLGGLTVNKHLNTLTQKLNILFTTCLQHDTKAVEYKPESHITCYKVKKIKIIIITYISTRGTPFTISLQNIHKYLCS